MGEEKQEELSMILEVHEVLVVVLSKHIVSVYQVLQHKTGSILELY